MWRLVLIYIWKGIRYHVIPFSPFSRSVNVRLCDPMNCSTPGFPFHYQLPELAQTHVHWISDAIQPPHLLSSPSPPTFNLSQLEGLFQWVSSSHQWSKYCSFIFSISPSNEYSGLIIPLNSRKSSRLNRLLLSIMIFSHEPTLLDGVGFLVTGILPV